jgi:cleavage stimulation factor subunit 2
MGRELRVDYSHVGGKDDTAPANYQAQPQQQQQQGYPPSSNGIGPLPPGAPLPHGLTCPDAISQTLNTLPVPQLLDILSQMKGYVMNDPAKATELLKQAPQLSYAIMQALLLMGLVDTNILATVVEQAAAPVPAPAPVPTPQQYPAAGQAQFPGYPPMPGQGFASTPPTQHPVYPPPPPQAVSVPPSQEELIKTVLALPQAQIDAMPPNERNAIMAIRYQHGGGRF